MLDAQMRSVLLRLIAGFPRASCRSGWSWAPKARLGPCD